MNLNLTLFLRSLAILTGSAFGIFCCQTTHAQITDIVTFNNTNGSSPLGGVTLSQDGTTLYGTTEAGGSANGTTSGTVFSVPVSGGAPTLLATFNYTTPESGLLLSGGALYGTTRIGGPNNVGTVFSVPVTGGTPSILASFNGTNGSNAFSGLTLGGGTIPTLYGATEYGGVNGDGVVFSVPVAGGTPTVVANFTSTQGTGSETEFLRLLNGRLYGTTCSGGSNNYGAVFSVPVTGGSPTILASFNGSNGQTPYGGLTLSLDGSTFYGTTYNGGANGDGEVYSVPVSGGTPTVLASFASLTSGLEPTGGLTLSADGTTLYGTTLRSGPNGGGTVFSVPVTGGTLTVLGSFNGANGSGPDGLLALSADGSTLYGTAAQGGANNDGVVFSVPTGVPEPGSAAFLLLTGFFMVATSRKRA